MNASSTFEKLKPKQSELTGKQRLIVLGIIGIIVMLIAYNAISDEEVTVVPNSPNTPSMSTGKTVSSSQKQDIQDAQVVLAAQVNRNPFALPPQLKENSNETGSAPIPNAYTSSIVPKSVVPNLSYGNLRLTGIIGTEGRNLAVITSGNKSKSYSVNEFIGPYKVMAITNDYVVIANADNKLVLRLETSGQKGGNNSEK